LVTDSHHEIEYPDINNPAFILGEVTCMKNPFADLLRHADSKLGQASSGQIRVLPISPVQARELLAQDRSAILLDVRTPEEHREASIPGNRLLPLQELSLRRRELPGDLNTPLILYCRSGARSAQAAELLIRFGYRRVYNLGGILSWPYELVRSH
jgi:phage shock protein E